MKKIMTVTGPKAPDTLGFCQCHEHLMISKGISSRIHPALCIDDIGKSMTEVKQFWQLGGGTIIDAQPGGCNRMETALFEISEASGVNIIASTGFHKLIFYPSGHWIFSKSRETLQQFFINELKVGMYTNIDQHLSDTFIPSQAGIIKAAFDVEGLTPVYKKCFQAAAGAAINCDTPLMVHIEQNSDPEYLLNTLLSFGMNPKRIIFCHMDRTILPLTLYQNILKQGISLEFDTIGRFKYHSDEDEARLFAALIRLGFEDQLLFSLDTTRERLRAYTDNAIGLGYILTVFLPMLKQFGITSQQIEKISHNNTIRVFT